MINHHLAAIAPDEPSTPGLRPSRHPRCRHDGCTAEVRFRGTGGYCLKHYHQHWEDIEMPPRKYTDDQIRAAMAVPGPLTAKAASIGIHGSALGDRARRLGLLDPPKPRAKPGQTGKTPAGDGKATTATESATLRQSPLPRYQGEALPASLADSGTELSRMAGIVQGFAALSATGRAWVLARIQTA